MLVVQVVGRRKYIDRKKNPMYESKLDGRIDILDNFCISKVDIIRKRARRGCGKERHAVSKFRRQ